MGPVAGNLAVVEYALPMLDSCHEPRAAPLPSSSGAGPPPHTALVLARRGAEREGADVSEIGWARGHNRVSTVFLEHTLAINGVRIAVALAAGSLRMS